jgi:hypothetical protein
MSHFTILYDEPHEAAWFRRLHPALKSAQEQSIDEAMHLPGVKKVLAYDRPDIVLLDNQTPILVIEETVEVPSGHNVGQRFARLAAAAENGVPSVYFGPYVAKKHGGATAGPRYMNVRLFHALDAMVRTTRTAVTTINWPVDKSCEVRRDAEKDNDVRAYLETFMDAYAAKGLSDLSETILRSDVHQRLFKERGEFVKSKIRKPEQYDGPPSSVEFLSVAGLKRRHRLDVGLFPKTIDEVVLYNVGMNYIRSDPYTGMAMLYHYVYVAEHNNRRLVLWFPNITQAQWRTAARNPNRKDIRMYRHAADAIAFADGLVGRANL